MRARTILLAVAAGLALADASVVTLALPDLLVELDTTVEGVAAVIGVYTIVLAAALIPAERLVRAHGAARVGAAGFAVFGVASLACGAAGSLGVLLVARGAQAAGGAAGLVAAFALLVGHVDDTRGARRLWLGAAVLSTAIGPALGGALTEAFAWEAIFLAQAPVAALAVIASLMSSRLEVEHRPVATQGATPAGMPERFEPRPSIALALVSAALTAVLFLLVLLLVAGWSVSPLSAAAAVTVIPLGALLGARLRGDARVRAALGCALVGLGTIALAFLPDANLAWTLVPQAFAGIGMGLALPALGGELLPEHHPGDAARLLTIRHAGIALALVLLAPIVSDRLDDATFRARERGVALVLDARLSPERKLDLAPALLAGVDERDPRGGLEAQIAARRKDFSGEELAEYDRLAERADDTLITAVGEAFNIAFVITGVLALLGAAALARRGRRPAWAIGAVAAGVVALGAYAAAHEAIAPEPVPIADPCEDRELPGAGGLGGFLQDQALQVLDGTACRLGSSREELVLAIANEDDAKRFRERHGFDPSTLGGLLGGLLGGG
jgi:MFS family permease